MLAEAKHAGDDWERFRWLVGTVAAAVRLVLRQKLRTAANEDRPPALTAVALYLGCLSLTVLAHLVKELVTQRIRSPWSEVCFPVLFVCFLSLIPLLIAIGVWACDNGARILCVAFAVVHWVSLVLWMRQGGASVTVWTEFKFLADLAVVAIGLSGRARSACNWTREDVPHRPLGIQ